MAGPPSPLHLDQVDTATFALHGRLKIIGRLPFLKHPPSAAMQDTNAPFHRRGYRRRRDPKGNLSTGVLAGASVPARPGLSQPRDPQPIPNPDEASPTYSTLIFDLSEVLISGLYGAEMALAARLGLPEKTVERAIWIPWAPSLFEGRLTERQYLDEVIRRSGWTGITAQEIGGYLRQNFCRRVPGMEDLIRRLSLRYELALLSDHAREWVEFIRQQHPVLECFSHQFFSYDLRHTKRERITFLTVLYKLGRQADECIFVDDLIANIEVARSVGIRGLQFTSASQLIADFAQLGVYQA